MDNNPRKRIRGPIRRAPRFVRKINLAMVLAQALMLLALLVGKLQADRETLFMAYRMAGTIAGLYSSYIAVAVIRFMAQGVLAMVRPDETEPDLGMSPRELGINILVLALPLFVAMSQSIGVRLFGFFFKYFTFIYLFLLTANWLMVRYKWNEFRK